MVRFSVLFLVLLAVTGCAAQPLVSTLCDVGSSVPAVISEVETYQADTECGLQSADYRSASAIGAVSQTRGQTRTVGVPRGFLVAMIILILLVGLA